MALCERSNTWSAVHSSEMLQFFWLLSGNGRRLSWTETALNLLLTSLSSHWPELPSALLAPGLEVFAEGKTNKVLCNNDLQDNFEVTYTTSTGGRRMEASSEERTGCIAEWTRNWCVMVDDEDFGTELNIMVYSVSGQLSSA